MTLKLQCLLVALVLGLASGCGDDDDDTHTPPGADGGAEEKQDSGGAGDEDDGNTVKQDSGGSPASCTPAGYQESVVTFCQTQFPAAPAAGELGASCVTDDQCDSGYCLKPYGSSAYCSLLCPQGSECPHGFSCQDSGTNGPMCYQGNCIYGGHDKADCVSDMNERIENACFEGCQDQLTAWIDCLVDAGRICGPAEADDRCGVEQGMLESCCVTCVMDL